MKINLKSFRNDSISLNEMMTVQGVALANVPEVRLSLAVELPEVRGLIARTIQMTLLSAFGNK